MHHSIPGPNPVSVRTMVATLFASSSNSCIAGLYNSSSRHPPKLLRNRLHQQSIVHQENQLRGPQELTCEQGSNVDCCIGVVPALQNAIQGIFRICKEYIQAFLPLNLTVNALSQLSCVRILHKDIFENVMGVGMQW